VIGVGLIGSWVVVEEGFWVIGNLAISERKGKWLGKRAKQS
jgi:hypothetical protein